VGSRAVDRGTGPAGGTRASRGAERGQVRHRYRQGQAVPPRHDLTRP
jgi:hypothetical protein